METRAAMVDLARAASKIEADSRTYTGGPIELFERVGRHTFGLAIAQGLMPHHNTLDFGAGCLRLGFWFIRFLDAGRYCAIEPVPQMIRAGRQHLFTDELWAAKAPTVHISDKCDMTHFARKFDFVIARSILTHTTPAMLDAVLQQFAEVATPSGQFLASYWPDDARCMIEGNVGDNMPADDWRFIKVVRYSIAYMRRRASNFGLSVEELNAEKINDQIWLKFTQQSSEPSK